MTSLKPLPSPLGFNSEFVINQPVTLIVKDRSGGDMSIQDESGRDVVRCEGQFMSTRKRFITPRGEHIFDLRKDRFSLGRAGWNIDTPRGEGIAHIDGHWTMLRKKLTINFVNIIDGGKETTLVLQEAGLMWNDHTVAVIGRQFGGAKQIFANRQTWGAEVAPGADLVFVAIIICSLNLIKKRGARNAGTAAAG